VEPVTHERRCVFTLLHKVLPGLVSPLFAISPENKPLFSAFAPYGPERIRHSPLRRIQHATTRIC
jgi:hypothetical protein